MPIAWYSGSFQPAPIATVSRPSDRTSSVASSWARTAGWRRSLLWTNALIRSFSVSAATVARYEIGPSWGTRWSGRIIVVTPIASAARARSPSCLADVTSNASARNSNGFIAEAYRCRAFEGRRSSNRTLKDARERHEVPRDQHHHEDDCAHDQSSTRHLHDPSGKDRPIIRAR